MTKRVTITMNSTAEETIYTGVAKMTESQYGKQISLYDPAGNILAVVQKDQTTLQSTEEENAT